MAKKKAKRVQKKAEVKPKAVTEEEEIESILDVNITAINRQTLTVTIKGLSRLVVNRLSNKTLGDIADGNSGKPQGVRGPTDPLQEYVDGMYWSNPENCPVKQPNESDEVWEKRVDAAVGKETFLFKTRAFRKALGETCASKDIRGVSKKFIISVVQCHDEFVPIKSDPPKMRRDITRNPKTNGAMVRYRGEFENWEIDLPLVYDADAIRIDQIVSLLNTAGFRMGVGENRNEKYGSWGSFAVKVG